MTTKRDTSQIVTDSPGGWGAENALESVRRELVKLIGDGQTMAKRLHQIMVAPERGDQTSLAAWDRIKDVLANPTGPSVGTEGAERIYVLLPGQAPPPGESVVDARSLIEDARRELASGD